MAAHFQPSLLFKNCQLPVASELLHDWRFTASQFVLPTRPLILTISNCILQLNTCYSPYVTSTVTRRWIYRLHLLLVHVSAVILRSESRGTHDHILLSQIQNSPNLEGQVLVFVFCRNRVARLYPQALGSLFVAPYNSQGCGGCIRPPPVLSSFDLLITPFARTEQKPPFP
jgi:hypothetical protein